MRYYCEIIPVTLAEKLKEKGMPMLTSVSIDIIEDKPVVDDKEQRWYRPMYAEVFDWLMIRYGAMILIVRHERKWDWWIGLVTDNDTYECSVEIDGELSDTWYEAANAAIEKALTLFKRL